MAEKSMGNWDETTLLKKGYTLLETDILSHPKNKSLFESMIFPQQTPGGDVFPVPLGLSYSIWATKKPLLLSIESWLVYRDPYFMAYYNPYIIG